MRYVHQVCRCGEIKGIDASSHLLFKGIRYACAERWESPEEVISWTGTYDATVQGPWCFQRDSFIAQRTGTSQFYYDETVEKTPVLYSEDCLSLNIWTPKVAEALPVIVYIHGGGYEMGGNFGFRGEHGQAYCDHGVIFVTINYRLNAFSSAVGPEHNGNYGLQDQICALQWIRHNISAFGGDPERITIMGESAGAMSVQNLIYAPAAKGLFSGAIMLSGAGLLPSAFRIKDSGISEELWATIQKTLGATSLDELKSLPAEKVFLTWKSVSEANRKFSCPATPIIDGSTIPDDPRKLSEEGNINAVPTIVGFLSEDMWPLDLYRASVEWGLLMERIKYPPVYGFYFDRAVPGSDYGAFHGADLRYVFHAFDTSWRPYDEIDERISANIIEYFSNFAKTGSPNGSDLATWFPITQKDQRFMHFGDDPCEMCSVPEDRLELVQARNKPFPGM